MTGGYVLFSFNQLKKIIMSKEPGSRWKLGMFVIIGLIVFAGTIYYVGKQNNLFGSTFHLTAQFKSAGGLKEGNNIRFSGINIGTVNTITLKDSVVVVDMVIRKNIQEFIKTDATAIVGSDGLMGDKVLTINSGSFSKAHVKDGDRILTEKAIDMNDIMASLKTNVDNAGIITAQLAAFTYKMNNGDGILSKVMNDETFANSLQSTLTNLQTTSKQFSTFSMAMNSGDGALALVNDKDFSNEIRKTVSNLQNTSGQFALFSTKMNDGEGTLSRLVTDEKIGKTLDSTMYNIQQATKKLDENMEALQHNFLLKGFFKKKAKADAKKAEELKRADDLKLKTGIPVTEQTKIKITGY
jgi:phospholipid/cholesterol/gamma-HCH transport system substrate-binding protein